MHVHARRAAEGAAVVTWKLEMRMARKRLSRIKLPMMTHATKKSEAAGPLARMPFHDTGTHSSPACTHARR